MNDRAIPTKFSPCAKEIAIPSSRIICASGKAKTKRERERSGHATPKTIFVALTLNSRKVWAEEENRKKTGPEASNFVVYARPYSCLQCLSVCLSAFVENRIEFLSGRSCGELPFFSRAFSLLLFILAHFVSGNCFARNAETHHNAQSLSRWSIVPNKVILENPNCHLASERN